MTFAPGSSFPFPVGATSTYQANLLLQSTYPDPLEVKITANAPDGVEVRFASAELITLPSGPLQKVPFTIGISPSLTPGHYEVVLSVIAPNPPRPSGGGVVLAPAFATEFYVDVAGVSSTVTLKAVSADDGRPLTGDLTLFYAGPTGQVQLAETSGTTLTATVVAGDYLATFVIDGLVHEQQAFTVAGKENKVVTFTVAGVQFVTSGAKAVADNKACTASADLVAIVRNTLAEVQGPVTFTVDVSHDGQQVESSTMGTLPVLPKGDTTQQSGYRPPNGFSAGTWTFHFRAAASTFSVESNPDAGFVVAACGDGGVLGWIEANPILAVGAAAGLAIALVLLVILILLPMRRRRRVFVATNVRIDTAQHLVLEAWWRGTASASIHRLAVRWEEPSTGRRSTLVFVDRAQGDAEAPGTWWATRRHAAAMAIAVPVPGPAGAPEPDAEVRITVTANPGTGEVVLGTVVVTASPVADVRPEEDAG